MLAPCRVTLTEPVAALLLGSAPLTTPVSSGSTAQMLPSTAPAVTDTRPFLLDPCEAEQSVEVCDAQAVASQALWPNRPDVVWTKSALLAPSTWTCSGIDPAATRFASGARPSPTLSTVQPDETLPVIASVVKASSLLPASPCPVLHASDESELHVVPSQAVAPARTEGLASNSPTPCPSTVTRVEPVAAALGSPPPLTLAVSAECTPVPLPI